MTLLPLTHDKHVLWRKTAGDWLARDLGLYDEHVAPYWILEDLPRDYGLFEQVTHPKAERSSTGKIRLDRFIFGHDGRKIRSAISLGKHISWALHGSVGPCTCDGCKVVTKPSASGSNVPSATASPRRTSPAPSVGIQFLGSPLATESANNPVVKAQVAGDAAAPVKAGPAVEATEPPSGDSKSRKKRARSSDDEDGRSDSQLAAATPAVPPVQAVSTAKKGRPRTSSNATDPKSLLPVIRRAKAASRRGWDYDSDDCGSSLGLSGMEDQDDGNASDATVVQRHSARDVLQPAAERTDAKIKSTSPTSSILYLPQDPSARQRVDLAEPCWRRAGELVWCRMPQNFASIDHTLHRRLTHWPGIVSSRNDSTAVPTYNVCLLAISQQDVLLQVHADDVLPWLGFVPHELSQYEVTQAVQAAQARFGTALSKRVALADVATSGSLVLRAIWYAACEAGRQLSSIHVLSPPRISNGAHLSPATQPKDSPIRALYVPRSNMRTMSYGYVFLGPELIHAGDFVRLASRVDLPAAVSELVTNKSPWTVHTSLILHVALFIKQVGRGSIPLVRGKIYEMVSCGIRSPESVHEGDSSAEDEGTPPLYKSGPSLPAAYPGHRMRCLTPGSNLFVDLSLDQIAGRYYPLAHSLQADLGLVDEIVERARMTGLAGESGSRPISLLLGGLVTGAGVPKINAPDTLAVIDSNGRGLPQDEERMMELELRERIRIADEQGLIAAGLLATPEDEITLSKPSEIRTRSPPSLPLPGGLPYSQAQPPPFLPHGIPAYPSPLTPGQLHWSPLPSYKAEHHSTSQIMHANMYPFPYVATVGSLPAVPPPPPAHMLPPPMMSPSNGQATQSVVGSVHPAQQVKHASGGPPLPTVVVKAWA
ncbi:hypothetical protein OIV83_006372 [Microbotryomycetes sp. JL201]|nr:hypothetical protein OIV83_006372 [Microbotryomycetes sp. JL201]